MSIEGGVQKRARRNAVRNTLISVIAAVPLLTVAMAAPKVLSALEATSLDNIFPRSPKQRIRENISRLKRKGYIRFENIDDKNILRLTALGERELRRIESHTLLVRKPRRWDRRWRVVIFDIAEPRKAKRDAIRRLLIRIGFLRLQDSVWVYPYDCEDVIALLKADIRIGKELLYLIADAVEFDAPLRKHFKLPLFD